MSVIVRFAPSPTGMLHIGGARTALFNYIFAKSQGGKFLLRIEDTDKERSTPEATKAILNGLNWLRIKYDDDIVYQSSRIERHREVVAQMLANGTAYYAYDTKEELDKEREEAEKTGKSYRYSGKWRDSKENPPEGVQPVVRIKMQSDKIVLNDLIKGTIEFDPTTSLDDFIILRSDGTPVYMLAVVVDDIDMGITHVIRGDDHLSNTPKQIAIYKAIGANVPEFGHIPLIHDESGKKMSKRKNAVAVGDYANLGILPDALKNYLLNLGWSYGDSGKISQEDAIQKFKISDVGSSPSRFDMDKLFSLNLAYIQEKTVEDLIDLIKNSLQPLNEIDLQRLNKILPELKKCNNLNDITSNAKRYLTGYEVEFSDEAKKLISENTELVAKIKEFMKVADYSDFKASWQGFLDQNGLKFGQVGPILRAMLIGTTNSTGLFAIIEALGVEEILRRIVVD